jgi:hypothetical protein
MEFDNVHGKQEFLLLQMEHDKKHKEFKELNA